MLTNFGKIVFLALALITALLCATCMAQASEASDKACGFIQWNPSAYRGCLEANGEKVAPAPSPVAPVSLYDTRFDKTDAEQAKEDAELEAEVIRYYGAKEIARLNKLAKKGKK